MIGKDKNAHQLRKANLKHLFGDVFDYIYCAGDFRKPKKEILQFMEIIKKQGNKLLLENKIQLNNLIDEHKNYSLSRRSLKPSAWIILIVWIFFSFGPGLMIGNELFGKPVNVESWSFGMPSIWVWQVIFWGIGILLVWFLAVKMEMSTSLEKNIVSQTEDINNT